MTSSPVAADRAERPPGGEVGALVALLPIVVLVVRIGIEEGFLRRALPGYAAYAERVRFRLVPGVW